MAITDCAITSGYTKDCGDSIGGIKTTYFAPLSNKATLTYVSGAVVTFTLSQGKKFYTFEMNQATGTASDDPKPNATNGSFYVEHKSTLDVPKRSASFSYAIKTLAVQDLMQIVLDQNGTYWLLGGTNGMRMQDSTSPYGQAMADFNGYKMVFLGMEPTMALQVPANIMAVLLSPAV